MITSTESSNAKAIEKLRSQLPGLVLQPGDQAYPDACRAWNLNISQRPAFVVTTETTDDIITAVQFAREANMGIGVMATGHGVGAPCNGGLLVNTSRMRGVRIDPISRTATVGAGALWKDVIPEAYTHGLACLSGSAPHVGVVGYTLGGGFGYLGRKYGLNSASVTAAEVVTADGKCLHLNDYENRELFWALKGSAGNFGIVSSLTFMLYPVTHVYGGAMLYPVENALEALNFYARWTTDLPDEVTAAFAFMNIPTLPIVPEMLRGKSVVIIRGCYCGNNPEQGAELFSRIREELGQPIMDTFATMPVTKMDTITNDPVDPMGVIQFSGMLSALTPDVIKTFVKLSGPGSNSPLTIVEFRQLGGALNGNEQHIKLMGNSNPKFSLNALGGTFTPDMIKKVQTYLNYFAEAAQPHLTGEVFVNYMEVDPAHDRVRSSYSAVDWDRLVALKTKYDPFNIFRFNRNIPPKKSVLDYL